MFFTIRVYASGRYVLRSKKPETLRSVKRLPGWVHKTLRQLPQQERSAILIHFALFGFGPDAEDGLHTGHLVPMVDVENVGL